MTPEVFKDAYKIDKRVDSLLEEIQGIREKMCCVRAVSFGHGGGRGNDASFVKDIIHMEILEEKLRAEFEKWLKVKGQVTSVLSGLSDPRESLVLRLMYIDGFSADKTGEILGLSRRTVWRIHDRALENAEWPAE